MNAIKRTISVKDVVDLLNELSDSDDNLVKTLFGINFACSSDLSFVKNLKISAQTSKELNFTVKLLDIINCLFGLDNDKMGTIGIQEDEETGKLVFFDNEIG